MDEQLRLSLVLISCIALCSGGLQPARAERIDSRSPRITERHPGAGLAPMECKNIPDFANLDPGGAQGVVSSGAPLQAGLQSATVPVETRMKLVVEYPISAHTSQPGDIFEGHVKEDMFFGRTLILPRGSLVRGRISDVLRPRLLSRAGKVGLKLDQIVTPTGEVIPLDASLEFQKGVTNRAGQLDPGTSFGTRVGDSVKTVMGVNETGAAKGALVAANVATLGAPIVATAIGSSAIALFRAGDDVSLAPGQELEILLTNDLGLQVN